jgi:hypothetical protein
MKHQSKSIFNLAARLMGAGLALGAFGAQAQSIGQSGVDSAPGLASSSEDHFAQAANAMTREAIQTCLQDFDKNGSRKMILPAPVEGQLVCSVNRSPDGKKDLTFTFNARIPTESVTVITLNTPGEPDSVLVHGFGGGVEMLGSKIIQVVAMRPFSHDEYIDLARIIDAQQARP